MRNEPIDVWNEVRFTSDGISISLFSESPEGGAVLEDEMWFTFDEIEDMAPAPPQSLKLSDQSRTALMERSRESAESGSRESAESGSRESAESGSQESAESGSRESAAILPSVGDVVRDANPPSWAPLRAPPLEVVGISDKSADEYIVEKSDFGLDKTVADENPSCDPDEPVIEAEYLSGNSNTYAFPVSRLEGILSQKE